MILFLEFRNVPLVPASNVGGEATELRRAASALVGSGELLGARCEVVVPAEPSTVASINVLNDIGQVECLEGVSNTLAVARRGLLASGQVVVGDEVREGIGFNDQSESSVGIALDEGSKLCGENVSFSDWKSER